jgi:hypothetical protein
LVAPAAATERPAPLSSQQLAPLLLSRDDMGDDWTAFPQDDAAPDPTGGYCNGPDARFRADEIGSVGAAQVAFIENPAIGPVLVEIVYTFPSVRLAKRFMTSTRAATRACSSWQTSGDDGGLVGIAIERRPAPKMGDDSFTVRQLIESADDGQAVDEITTVRARDVVVTLGNRAFSSVDGRLSRRYLRKALVKLRPAIGR